MAAPKTAVIVPTLGRRPDYLEQCLRSVRSSGNVYVRLTAPIEYEPPIGVRDLCDDVLVDVGDGLANAITQAINTLPSSIEYVNWLGDDDQLLPAAVSILEEVLNSDHEAVLVFGRCAYVDATGELLFNNPSGTWAKWLLSFGPQLISQPAMLFRRSFFEQVGGLNSSLKFAFDLELLLKARRSGKIRHVNTVIATYRWHSDALTVGGRRRSVMEASEVRIQNLSPSLRWASVLWEPLIRNLILLVGFAVSSFASRRRFR